MLTNTTEHRVNVRSFDPTTPESRPFTMYHSSVDEVVRKNTDTNLAYADYLHHEGLLDLLYAVDAVQLGYIPSWQQSDYLRFWLLVMDRPQRLTDMIAIEQGMNNYEATHRASLEQMNNSKLAHTQRRQSYTNYGRAYNRVTDGLSLHPVERVVQLVDGDRSLGGSVERSVARRHKTQVLRPGYGGHTTADFISEVNEVDGELAADFARLHAFGARIVTLSREPGFSFQPIPL